MTILTYLLVLSVTLGSPFFALPLGGINLSLYRITILVLVLALTYLILIKDKRIKLSFGHRSTLSPYQLFYIIWLIYAVISVLWVESLSRWFFAVFYLTTGIFSIVFISSTIKDELQTNKLLNVAFISTLFHHFFGWIEIIFNKYFWADVAKIDPNNYFPQGVGYRFPITTFANQNDYATLILAGIFISFIVFKNTDKSWVKGFVTFYFISAVMLLRLTGSRLNIIALMIGLAILLLIKIMDYKSSRLIFKMFLLIGSVSSVLYLLIEPFQTTILKVVSWVFKGPIGPATSPRYRLNMIINGFSFLLKTYGIGVGAGNLEVWMEKFRIVTVDAPNMHNWFMEILTNYGVLIFIPYVLMYLFMLIKLFYVYKYSKNRIVKNISEILFVYVIVFIISSSASSSMTPAEWQWVLWGIIIGFIQYTEKKMHIKREIKSIEYQKEKIEHEYI